MKQTKQQKNARTISQDLELNFPQRFRQLFLLLACDKQFHGQKQKIKAIFKELLWLVFCVGLLWIKTALLVLPISDCKQHQISEIHYWNVHPFPGCKGYDFSLRPYEWGSSPNCIPWEGWRADINFLMQTLFAQLTKMVQSLRRQLIRLDAWISAQNPQNSRDMQI